MCFPANCNGAPDKDPLYVSKHNAIGNFGDPPFCLDSGEPDNGDLSHADPQEQRLVAAGDAYLGGGGQVATVLVTSHGPRGVQDGSAYNHYSLLATTRSSATPPWSKRSRR